jgi:hypothetical protein
VNTAPDPEKKARVFLCICGKNPAGKGAVLSIFPKFRRVSALRLEKAPCLYYDKHTSKSE